jgi:hypothetical protein
LVLEGHVILDQICAQIFQQMREIEGVVGAHVMAYRQEHIVADIVHRAGLFPRISPATIEAQKRSAYVPLA